MAEKSGDACPGCRAGRFGTVSSVRCGAQQVRYLRCAKCGATSKQIVPAADVRRRA